MFGKSFMWTKTSEKTKDLVEVTLMNTDLDIIFKIAEILHALLILKWNRSIIISCVAIIFQAFTRPF